MTVLEALGFLGRQQQSLAEAQFSGKFKLKFIWILMKHSILYSLQQMHLIIVAANNL